MKKFNNFIKEDLEEKSIKVLMLNCTLKSEGDSNTRALLDRVKECYDNHSEDVLVEIITPSEYKMDYGNSVEKLSDDDQFPEIYQKMLDCDIIIIGSAIWFGQRTSITSLIFERLIGAYGKPNKLGQPKLYNKIGGVVVTGNEDGVHGVASITLFNLAHLGCIIPPNPDCYWVGDAGPGKSYIEAGGDTHPYTNKTAEFLAHNTIHACKMVKSNPFKTDLNDLERKSKRFN